MTRRPIDSTLFTDDPDIRSFTIDVEIRAPIQRVWNAWTQGDAFRRAYDPDRETLVAEIDLAVGGRYEWLWDGKTGSNDCQVLCFLPGRLIAFSWNAPPSQPESRSKRTWVVVELSPVDAERTSVRLTHAGFGAGAHWRETEEYFASAWPHVLGRLRENLERGVR